LLFPLRQIFYDSCRIDASKATKGSLSDTHPMVRVLLWLAVAPFAKATEPALSPTSIFAPVSTPANSVFFSLFVLESPRPYRHRFHLVGLRRWKYRKRAVDGGREPPQIYGSNQVELA
jgi:hypothetical protein